MADLSLSTDAPTDAFAMAVGQDNRLIVGTSSDMVSIDMDPERWTAACELAGRKLTRDEWSRFLPSTPYAPACG